MAKKKTYQAVDSNLPQDRPLNIHELAQSATEKHLAESYIQLERKAVGLSEMVNKLLKEIESREEEITHLKQLLNSTVENNNGLVTVMPISDEEFISDVQLRKLKEKAKISELTLDETRRFDILVKNKRLAQGSATTIEGSNLNKQDNGSNKKNLIQIASKKMTGDSK